MAGTPDGISLDVTFSQRGPEDMIDSRRDS